MCSIIEKPILVLVLVQAVGRVSRVSRVSKYLDLDFGISFMFSAARGGKERRGEEGGLVESEVGDYVYCLCIRALGWIDGWMDGWMGVFSNF